MTENPDAPPWLNAYAQHEGSKVALRVRPSAVDTPESRRAFPHLAVVVHALADVRTDGMPVPEYNHTLFDFDDDVHDLTERDADGLVVMVITSDGRRTYFAYVADLSRWRDRMAELRAKYPGHALDLGEGDDPDWNCYAEHRERFGWP